MANIFCTHGFLDSISMLDINSFLSSPHGIIYKHKNVYVKSDIKKIYIMQLQIFNAVNLLMACIIQKNTPVKKSCTSEPARYYNNCYKTLIYRYSNSMS